MTSAPKVVLADDHPPTRYGVRMSLEAGGFRVVSEVGNGEAAIAAVAEHRPEVALLDIHMPGSGIAAAGQIARDCPETAIVMLTASREDEDLFAALQAGAIGYLLKDTDPDRLPRALQGVLDGEAALPRTLVARLIRDYQRGSSRRRVPLLGPRKVQLSDREFQVLELLGEELTTREIADRLDVSAVTIRRHISGLLHKLDAGSRTDAVRMLEEAG